MAEHLVHGLHRHGEESSVDAEHEHPNHFLPSCSHSRVEMSTAREAWVEADVATSTSTCVVCIQRSSCWPRRSIAITASALVVSAPVASLAISAAAVLERSASRRTSSATTAKPRPDSPARAASIAALSASRAVWSAMSLRTVTTCRISSTRFALAVVRSLDACRSVRARLMLSRSSTAWSTTRTTDSATEGMSFVSRGSGTNVRLSSTIGLLRAFPTRARQVSGERALSGRGRCNLLGGDRDGAAAFGDALDGEHNLVGGRALLLGRELDLAAHLGHGPHHREPSLHLLDAFLQRHDGLAALRLRAFDQLGDLPGGRLGALGEPAHLVCDYGKSTTGVARAGVFDGGVEGEQVGLICDVVDEVEDALYLVDPTGKREGAIAGGPELCLGELQVGLHLAGLDGDAIDGVGDRRRGGRALLHARRGGRSGGGLLLGRRGKLLGGGGELAGGLGDLASQPEEDTTEAFDHGVEGVAETADLTATFEVHAGGQVPGLNARCGAGKGRDRSRGVDGEHDREHDQKHQAQGLEQRGSELLLVDRSERGGGFGRRDDHPTEGLDRFVPGQDVQVPVVDHLGRPRTAIRCLIEDRPLSRDLQRALGNYCGIVREDTPPRAVNKDV